MTTYEVRFVCYRHNDGRANNGFVQCQKRVPTLEEARHVAKHLAAVAGINEQSRMHAQQYIHDGYIERIDGIWKITEEKVSSDDKTGVTP